MQFFPDHFFDSQGHELPREYAIWKFWRTAARDLIIALVSIPVGAALVYWVGLWWMGLT